tara:strand:+ start:103 stop:516 length:414 start_codon:yes stop_codon:yes gene_type:complete
MLKYFGMLNFNYKNIGGWLGIISIIFISIFPLVSQATATLLDQPNNIENSNKVVVCSVNGIKIISFNDQDLSNKGYEHNGNVCQYCNLSSVQINLEDKGEFEFLKFPLNKPVSFNYVIHTKEATLFTNNNPNAPPFI